MLRFSFFQKLVSDEDTLISLIDSHDATSDTSVVLVFTNSEAVKPAARAHLHVCKVVRGQGLHGGEVKT